MTGTTVSTFRVTGSSHPSPVQEHVLFAATVGALVALLYGVILVVYRATIHPLARYPGPKLAAATKWYEFYFDILKSPGGQFMFEINRMHERYGPIVRINPDELHVSDPEWYEVLHCAGSAVRDKYPPSARLVGTPLGVFGTIDHHVHRTRKGPLAAYFSRRSVLEMTATMRNQLDILAGLLRERAQKRIILDVRQVYLAFSTDTLSIISFKHSRGLQGNDEKVAEWLKTMNGVAVVTPFFKQFPAALPWLMRLPRRVIELVYPTVLPMVDLHRVRASQPKLLLTKDVLVRQLLIPFGVQEMYSQASGMVKGHDRNNVQEDLGAEHANKEPQTVLAAILQSPIPASEKSVARLAQDGFLLITAGGDPPARTMAIATFHLLSNKLCLDRLTEELDILMPDPRHLAPVKDLEALPYLTAVIKETMRIVGLVTSRLPLISRSAPLQYKDWTIPAGTPVSTTIHQVLNDKDVFRCPSKFDPDRWLDSEKDLNRFYVPFGRGHRACLGQNLAMAEMYMTLAMVFRRFQMELFDTFYERDVMTVRDCFLGETSKDCRGIRVRITGERK